MSENIRKEERDKVLLAFHQASDRPSVDLILEWVDRYPEYADDIRAHAAVGHEWAAREEGRTLEPSQALLARNYSNALNALYHAHAPAAPITTLTSSTQSFHDIAAARGKTVVSIAREIDIARGVIADLFNGWMSLPIRGRLVHAVCSVLLISPDIFYSVLTLVLQTPRIGHAKASGPPVITARSCDDIIRESGMTPERTRHWLEED
jgi:hypothetical protein